MTALTAYRDDGPLAALLGRTFGAAVGASPALLTLVGIVPLIAVLAGPDANPGNPGTAAALAWFVALAGVASARPDVGRLSWLVPPILRAAEYSFLLRVTALRHAAALPLCFALLAALAYHHYDTVYRLRHQRVAPPRWLQIVGGGWELRILLAYGLLLLGALDVALGAAAVILGALFITESSIGWVRFGDAEQQRLGEEDEDAL